MSGYLLEDTLLQQHLLDVPKSHEDTFVISLLGSGYKSALASKLLASVLEGFLLNAPKGVSRLMMLRNVLVKPLGLRTSPLGCPVSSLLSESKKNLFANKYPVLDQVVNDKDTRAQVILGADDKHLKFRSCVGVKIVSDTKIEISLGTRVHCNNLFGKFYMLVIDYVHRNYITPTMLRRAVEFAVLQEKLEVK